MRISHVHKTRTNSYQQNKHTLAKVLMTYTCGPEIPSGGPHSLTFTVEDLRKIEVAFVQIMLPNGDYYSDPGITISGNKITITEATTNSNEFIGDGSVIVMRLYGTQ